MSTERSIGALWTRGLRLVRSPAFVYLMSAGLARSAAVFLIPLYTRKLSLAEYGEYALAATVSTLLAALFSLGLSSAVSRFYFDGVDREDGARQSGSVARWITVLVAGAAMVSTAAVWTFAPPAGAGLFSRHALLMVVFNATGAALSPVLLVYFRTLQRAYVVAALQMIEFTVTVTCGITFVLFLKRGFFGVLEASALSACVMGLNATFFIWRKMRGSLDRELLRRAVTFSGPFLLQVFANWLLSAADRWALKTTGRDAEVGTYSLATQFTTAAAMPTAALADAEFARVGEIYRAEGMPGVATDLVPARRRYLLISALPAVALIAVIPLIRLLLGPAAASATVLVPALCLVVLIDAQFYPGQVVVYCASRSRYIAFITAATVVLNLGALALLTPTWGVLGALVAKALGSIARVLTCYVAQRLCLREPRPAIAA